MRGLASFASSEAGKAFARVEQYYGRDPAAWLEGEEGDEVLAHNLRAAFIVTLNAYGDAEEHQDEVERTKRAGAAIRDRLNG